MRADPADACGRAPAGSDAGATGDRAAAVQSRPPSLHVLLDPQEKTLPEGLSEGLIHACCLEALLAQSELDLGLVSDVEVSLQLLDSGTMRSLNQQYRGQDRPTNILSFDSGLPLMVAESEATDDQSSGGLLVLGDLVLCPEVVAREAAEQGKPPRHHWAHLLVHGTLHLCGHDHEQPQHAQNMEQLEIRILSGLSIPDPYAVTSHSE